MTGTVRVCLKAVVIACALGFAARAEAATISIAWDPNTESDLAGYVVSYGTTSGQYTQSVDVGLSTAWNLSVSDTRTYFFRVQAYNRAGLRSGYSNEAAGTAGVISTPTTPTPAMSRPAMNVDIPAANSTVQPGFTIAGWATDLGSSSGSGIDVVHVWAANTNGSAPVFIGAATLGYDRPDVAAAFGAPQAAKSGFMLNTAALAPGVYDVTVFAHSVLAAAFNNARVLRVTVGARASHPMMVVDTPSAGASVGTTFNIGGWALDLAATSGSGVDTVHVWAYPASGAPPIFVGACATGVRPDVGAVFGKQFAGAGYDIIGKLAPGSYNLVVFARSTVADAFNNTVVVPITVR